jgi:hypothetical protein
MKHDWENPPIITERGYFNNYKYNGWDWHLDNTIRGNRFELLAYLSRVYNIGEIGVHCRPDEYNSSIKLESWAGDRDLMTNPKYKLTNIQL